ncbi:hypothetical protein IWZ03DRAFT_435390 [Phyllosticta citriasiana]|uniref:Uncharacterized protein n=1 Tax=Phyllosticta citriasiana TaxID=595635 RepID=A0ABR1KUW9_9PEZI
MGRLVCCIASAVVVLEACRRKEQRCVNDAHKGGGCMVLFNEAWISQSGSVGGCRVEVVQLGAGSELTLSFNIHRFNLPTTACCNKYGKCDYFSNSCYNNPGATDSDDQLPVSISDPTSIISDGRPVVFIAFVPSAGVCVRPCLRARICRSACSSSASFRLCCSRIIFQLSKFCSTAAAIISKTPVCALESVIAALFLPFVVCVDNGGGDDGDGFPKSVSSYPSSGRARGMVIGSMDDVPKARIIRAASASPGPSKTTSTLAFAVPFSPEGATRVELVDDRVEGACWDCNRLLSASSQSLTVEVCVFVRVSDRVPGRLGCGLSRSMSVEPTSVLLCCSPWP